MELKYFSIILTGLVEINVSDPVPRVPEHLNCGLI